MRVIGIDSAKRGTGIVIMEDGKMIFKALIKSSKVKNGIKATLILGDKESSSMHKNDFLFSYYVGEFISHQIRKFKIENIVIEDYSYKSIGKHITIAEYTGAIKTVISKKLSDKDVKFHSISRTSHYSNFIGKGAGSAQKEDLIASIHIKDGIEFNEKENDIADAYSLCKYFFDKLV